MENKTVAARETFDTIKPPPPPPSKIQLGNNKKIKSSFLCIRITYCDVVPVIAVIVVVAIAHLNFKESCTKILFMSTG